MRGLLSVDQLDRARIGGLLEAAGRIAAGERATARPEAVIASMFFEDSLRTRIGFEVAAARLGASVTQVSGLKRTVAMGAPEDLRDASLCVGDYCDLILLRHPEVAAPRIAAAATSTTIVNCGNGDDEHPTQALIDLLAIEQLAGGIERCRVAVVGDLCGMRTAHSLLLGLAQYDGVEVRAIAPPGRGMPDRYAGAFRASGNSLTETDAMDLSGVDVVYVAGLPSTPENGVTHQDQAVYRIDAGAIEQLDAETKILCPLPRVDEISREVDATRHARYFEQHALGMGMRIAILDWLLGEALPDGSG